MSGSSDHPRASLPEEGLVLALAVAAGVAWRVRATGFPLALALFPALLFEAYGPLAPRARADAARRTIGFAIALVAAVVHARVGAAFETALLVILSLAAVASAAREAVRAGGPSAARFGGALALVAVDALARPSPDYGLAATIALASAFALVPEERLPRALERIAWIAIALRLLDQIHGLALAETARVSGVLVGALAVLVAACAALFAVLRTFTRTSRVRLAPALLALAVAAVAALEGGLRLKQQNDPDVFLQFAPVPLVAAGDRELVTAGLMPRLDLRARPFAPSKARGTYRLAILGGSSVYGHAQKLREKSVSGLLEARLAATFPDRRFEVICLALPGFTSDHEAALVLGHALAWDVDLFLTIDGGNDIGYMARCDAFPGDIYLWPQHCFVLRRPFLRTMLRRSLLFQPLVRARITPPQALPENQYTPGTSNRFYLDGLVANHESIAIVASDAGARLAWSFSPLLQDRIALGPGEEGALPRTPFGPEIARRSAEVRARVRPAIEARGGVDLDLCSRISRRSASATGERWFIDNVHYTDRGQEVLAEEIIGALVETKVLVSR